MQRYTTNNKKYGAIRHINNHAKNVDINVDGLHTQNNEKLFS